MTLPAISQNDTASSDILIALPRKYVLKAIKELEACSLNREELGIVKENYYITEEQLRLQKSIIEKYKSKDETHNIDITNLNLIIDEKDQLIKIQEKRNRKLKRTKNGLLIGGTTIAVGLGILVIVTSL
ncbi:hypothetical protein OAA15_00120 [bacterium]|nr:hypothetical protein [bacterium]